MTMELRRRAETDSCGNFFQPLVVSVLSSLDACLSVVHLLVVFMSLLGVIQGDGYEASNFFFYCNCLDSTVMD